MTGLGTHPMLGEYRLAELRQDRKRRARHAHALQLQRPEPTGRRTARTMRAVPVRIRRLLRA